MLFRSWLAAKEAELQLQAWPYKVKDLGVKWQIEWTEQNTVLSVPGVHFVTPISDNWELQAATSEKDVLESDAPIIESITATDLTALRKYLIDGDYQFASDSVGIDGQTVLDLLAHGITSMVQEQPILRRVRMVSSNYAIKDSLSNVGKVIKASTINALEGVPTDLLFNLPTAYTPSNSIAGITRHYGWFKRYPSVLQQAEGKWQITIEYHWGLWSDDIYEFV